MNGRDLDAPPLVEKNVFWTDIAQHLPHLHPHLLCTHQSEQKVPQLRLQKFLTLAQPAENLVVEKVHEIGEKDLLKAKSTSALPALPQRVEGKKVCWRGSKMEGWTW